ncbi:MAG: YHS domain-containing protein [Thermoplasmata archaeon]
MQVKDPVCGMKIEDSTAAAWGTYGGVPVFFCSEACRRSYERTLPPRPK